jgi:nitrite reductase (NADH) large subunit
MEGIAMSKDHFVVIGNGPAGNQAALTLREKAPNVRIRLISKDREASYRPRLLPDYIAGKIEQDALYTASISSYKDKGIKLRCGQRVVDLNIERKEIILDHKEVIPFTGVIVAVGGQPRIPERLRAFSDLMFTLKTIDDARGWIEKLASVESILMIGGDLTSFAVTRALLHLRKKVYFMLDEDAFWPLRSDDASLEEAGQRLRKKGVAVLGGRTLKSIARLSDDLIEVNANNQRIEVGMIGAFFGLIPNIPFLARSGLTIDRGILVDEYLNAGFEDVYATGDCAQVYHPKIRDYWVSIGHDNAVALGRIAATNLLGGKVPADVAPESIHEIQGIRVNTSWWMEY